MSKHTGPFKVEVQADNTGTWAGNMLEFETVDAAKAYAEGLWSRWMAVKAWRVVDIPTGQPVLSPLEPHSVV